jgi:hypothetical protein
MTIRLAQFGLFGSGELWAKIPIPWSAPLRRPTVSARGGDDFILRIFRSGIAPTHGDFGARSAGKADFVVIQTHLSLGF